MSLLLLWLARLTHLYCITTFSDVCYWSLRSERMVPTAEQISGAWRSRIRRPQTSQYVGCRPYCWSSPRSLMTIAALVRHKIISSCNCVLLKDCWIWWLVLVAENSMDDCPRESRLPSKLPASVSKTPKWIIPLSLFV